MSEYTEYEEITLSDDNSSYSKSLIENNDDDFGEVLQLTAYDGGGLSDLSATSTDFNVVAQYDKIDIVKTDKTHQAFAKKYVQKINKLITEFDDLDLSEEHAQYVKDVAQLQLENLADMLSLVDINRQMLNNIVHRINAVQAEDYAMISTYTSLMNQHMRLVKELQNTYKNIPQVLKKMRTEVITKPELMENNDVITEDYGTTQFNNQKMLLKKLREAHEINN
jgi:hypothetical protein|nr:MAG TPA: hypothetical protein [Caudoviricetes sp.]